MKSIKNLFSPSLLIAALLMNLACERNIEINPSVERSDTLIQELMKKDIPLTGNENIQSYTYEEADKLIRSVLDVSEYRKEDQLELLDKAKLIQFRQEVLEQSKTMSSTFYFVYSNLTLEGSGFSKITVSTCKTTNPNLSGCEYQQFGTLNASNSLQVDKDNVVQGRATVGIDKYLAGAIRQEIEFEQTQRRLFCEDDIVVEGHVFYRLHDGARQANTSVFCDD